MLDFGNRWEPPTVLLIDDDMISREVAATLLTMSGYTVHTAPSGKAALQLLASGACVPGVILMDAQMPRPSGITLIKKLRARSPAKIYAISGSGAPSDVLAASDGFLLKPFGPDDLRNLHQGRQPHSAPSAARQSEPQTPVNVQPAAAPPPASIHSEQVVNSAILAQLREMMSNNAVRQIYVAIVADLGRRIAALEVAIAANNLAEIRRIGHAIKGGCGMAGAAQAARLGAALESTVNHLDNSSTILDDLRAATRNLERMLESEFPA